MYFNFLMISFTHIKFYTQKQNDVRRTNPESLPTPMNLIMCNTFYSFYATGRKTRTRVRTCTERHEHRLYHVQQTME